MKADRQGMFDCKQYLFIFWIKDNELFFFLLITKIGESFVVSIYVNILSLNQNFI